MRVPMRGTGAERPVVAVKSGKPDGAKGSRHSACSVRQPQKREERSGQAKPFCISKWVVLDAYKRVRAKRGAAGVDSESIEVFERDLKNDLYRIWNRMSSGTYFPPPVKTVEIPKKDGGVRSLGIPTVSDRVAQTVVKLYLEPVVEPSFHPDSYGYRPKKSALDAVGVARQRCWQYDWVIDLDIRGFFDNLDHALVMRAVKKYTRCRWILLYVKRWLEAPAIQEDGTLVSRTKGTPQGGVISPLLANIFLHLSTAVENVSLSEPRRGGSVATGAGRLSGSREALMTRPAGQRMRGLLGSPVDGSPWRAQRGGASGSCCPGC